MSLTKQIKLNIKLNKKLNNLIDLVTNTEYINRQYQSNIYWNN